MATAKDKRDFIGAALALRPDALRHVLISASGLRKEMRIKRAGWTKHRFDATALALAREGVITLHQHDHPQELAPAERVQMIADDRGIHYVGFVIEAEAVTMGADLLKACEKVADDLAPDDGRFENFAAAITSAEPVGAERVGAPKFSYGRRARRLPALDDPEEEVD